ncbi:MAG: class I SAM-dependent methyltransferase [Halobacteriales archaeon]
MAASPVTAPNEAVVATYDRFAALYDWLVSPLAAGTRDRALDGLRLDRGDRALEVGCGPGHALVGLADRVGPAGHVVGLDAAPGMLGRAERRVARAGIDAGVTLVLGDARSLPLGDGVADAALLEDTLELFGPDDRDAVLGELRRVLAADGRLAVLTMERAGAERTSFVRAYDWVFDNVPGANRVGCRPIYARRALEAAGFAVEERASLRRAGVWPVELLVARPA